MAERWWLQDSGAVGCQTMDGGRRVLGARFGGLGGFGGGVACKTAEPDYIGRCNITKIASSFHLCDGVLSRWVGQIGKFACQIVDWEGRCQQKFRVRAYTVQNARRNIQGASFFLEMVLIYFL